MCTKKLDCEKSDLDSKCSWTDEGMAKKIDPLILLERWTKLGVEFEMLERENAKLKRQINFTRSCLRVIASKLI